MSQAAQNALWARTLLENLQGAGVQDVVISPGSRSTPLVLAADAAHREGALETHVILDERVAGFYGLGLARSSGAPVVLMCTSGSAGAHYLPAIIEARHAGLPLVVITADRPRELHYAGSPQTIDQLGFFGSHVLRSFALSAPGPESPAWLAGVAAQAVFAATGSPGGPVHINAPFRKTLWAPGEEDPGPVHRAEILSAVPGLDPAAAQEVAALVAEASRGVIVCGPQIGPRGGQLERAPLSALALGRALGWPVLADPLSGLRHHPQGGEEVLCTYDLFLREGPHLEGLEADLVLRCGRAPTSRHLLSWLGTRVSGPGVLVDPHGPWRDPLHRSRLMIQGDPSALFDRILESVPARPPGDWAERWLGLERATQSALEAEVSPEAHGPLWEGVVIRRLMDALPDGSQLHIASSLAIRDVDAYGLSSTRSLTLTSNRGANGIDGTLATAAGQGRRWPRGETAVLLGDLALLHDLGGLLAAREAGADLLVVVIDNGGGAIFERLPVGELPDAFERYFLTPQKTPVFDLCQQIAHGAIRATTDGEVQAGLEALGRSRGVRVLVVPIEGGLAQEHTGRILQVLADDAGSLQS